jgi:anti-sigma factor RsiW
MHCPIQSRENAELLLAYVERKLEPEVAATFERHVEACAACREAVAAQSAVWSALDQWEAAEITADFDRRLYARIEADHQRAWWRRVFEPVLPGSLRPAMPMAAAAMLLIAVGLFQAPSEADWQRDKKAAIDVEQVESTLDDLEMLRQLGVAAPVESGDKTTL